MIVIIIEKLLKLLQKIKATTFAISLVLAQISAHSQQAADIPPLSYAKLIPPPIEWAVNNSYVRMARLSNGDGLIVRCRSQKGKGCYTSKSKAAYEIRLISNKKLVMTSDSIEKILNGGAIIRLNEAEISTTLPQQAFPTMVRTTSGTELVVSNFFDEKRNPGCIGGLAPLQLWINENAFAFFLISQKPNVLKVDKRCSDSENAGKVSTKIKQVMPDILYWYEDTNSYLYLPILENYILVLDVKKINSGPIENGKLYVLNMRQWPESDWKALSVLLNVKTSDEPLDFQSLYDKLTFKFQNMKAGVNQ